MKQKVITFGLTAIIHGFIQQIIINNLARRYARMQKSSKLGVGPIHSLSPSSILDFHSKAGATFGLSSKSPATSAFLFFHLLIKVQWLQLVPIHREIHSHKILFFKTHKEGKWAFLGSIDLVIFFSFDRG